MNLISISKQLEKTSLHETLDFKISSIKQRNSKGVILRAFAPSDILQYELWTDWRKQFPVEYSHNSTSTRQGFIGGLESEPKITEKKMLIDLNITKYSSLFVNGKSSWWQYFAVGQSVGKLYMRPSPEVDEITLSFPERVYIKEPDYSNKVARDIVRKKIGWHLESYKKKFINPGLEPFKSRLQSQRSVITKVSNVDFANLEHYVSNENHVSARWGSANYPRNGDFYLEFNLPNNLLISDNKIVNAPDTIHIKLYKPLYRHQVQDKKMDKQPPQHPNF